MLSRVRILPPQLNIDTNVYPAISGGYSKKKIIEILKGCKYIVFDGINYYAVNFQVYDSCSSLNRKTFLDYE